MRMSSIVLTVAILGGVFFWWKPTAKQQAITKVKSILQQIVPKQVQQIKPNLFTPTEGQDATQPTQTSKKMYQYTDSSGQMVVSDHKPTNRNSKVIVIQAKDINTYEAPINEADKAENGGKIRSTKEAKEYEKTLDPFERMRQENIRIQQQMQDKREKMIDELVNE